MNTLKNWLLSALVLAVVIFFTRIYVPAGSYSFIRGASISFVCASVISTYSFLTVFLFLLLLETVYGHVTDLGKYMNVFYIFNLFIALFFVTNAKNSAIKGAGENLFMFSIPFIFFGLLFILLRYWGELNARRIKSNKTRGVISLIFYGLPVSLVWFTGFILVLAKSVSMSLRLLGKAPV